MLTQLLLTVLQVVMWYYTVGILYILVKILKGNLIIHAPTAFTSLLIYLQISFIWPEMVALDIQFYNFGRAIARKAKERDKELEQERKNKETNN